MSTSKLLSRNAAARQVKQELRVPRPGRVKFFIEKTEFREVRIAAGGGSVSECVASYNRRLNPAQFAERVGELDERFALPRRQTEGYSLIQAARQVRKSPSWFSGYNCMYARYERVESTACCREQKYHEIHPA